MMIMVVMRAFKLSTYPFYMVLCSIHASIPDKYVENKQKFSRFGKT